MNLTASDRNDALSQALDHAQNIYKINNISLSHKEEYPRYFEIELRYQCHNAVPSYYCYYQVVLE